MDFKIVIPQLDAMIESLASVGGNADRLINLAIKAGILRVQLEARTRAPHRTGTLQRSILPEFSSLHGEVKVNEKYGLYIEQGTGPFEIRPKNKKALMWPGALHPVKVVHHPGIKARPFFQPAIEASKEFIESQFIVVYQTMARALAEKTRI
jgi:hypothetical protein